MLVDYNELSQEAKVFAYPSSRKFYASEIESIHNRIQDFLSQWLDTDLCYKIVYDRFILFFVDEEIAIPTEKLDELATFILVLEVTYNITLLDKVNVCFKQGEFVQYQDMKNFRQLVKNKSVSKKTIVFNNFIQNKYEFENVWEILITDSWLSHLVK